jgi:hypothetical protein
VTGECERPERQSSARRESRKSEGRGAASSSQPVVRQPLAQNRLGADQPRLDWVICTATAIEGIPLTPHIK